MGTFLVLLVFSPLPLTAASWPVGGRRGSGAAGRGRGPREGRGPGGVRGLPAGPRCPGAHPRRGCGGRGWGSRWRAGRAHRPGPRPVGWAGATCAWRRGRRQPGFFPWGPPWRRTVGVAPWRGGGPPGGGLQGRGRPRHPRGSRDAGRGAGQLAAPAGAVSRAGGPPGRGTRPLSRRARGRLPGGEAPQPGASVRMDGCLGHDDRQLAEGRLGGGLQGRARPKRGVRSAMRAGGAPPSPPGGHVTRGAVRASWLRPQAGPHPPRPRH